MQASRTCPSCHHTVDASLEYCPYCHNAVLPELLDSLHWMYRTIQDLDRRIALGQGSLSITELRNEISAEYLAKRTESGAVTVDASVPISSASSRPETLPVAQPFSFGAFFADQSIAILAYTGAFLLLVATLSFEIGGWQVLGNTAKLSIVVVVYALFGIAGLILLSRERFRTISQAYLGIFALMTPLVGLAAYEFYIRTVGFSVQGMISVTAWYTTLVYLALAVRTRFQAYSYMGWIAGVLAAQSIIFWADIDTSWTSFTLAISAIVLLAPHNFRLPDYFARPALIMSGIGSVLAALIIEIQGAVIVIGSLAPDTGAQSLQQPFTLASVSLALLMFSWSLTARRSPSITRPNVIQLLDLATLAVAIQSLAAIGGDEHIAHVPMGDSLAILGVVAAICALVYGRVRPDYLITRWGAWILALTLPILGWLINVNLPGVNQPLIVSLGIGAAISVVLAVSESAPWWLVYGGLAVSVIFHDIVGGILLNAGAVPGTTGYAMANAWWHVGFTVGLWAISLFLTESEATRRFNRPIYVVAALNGLYASLLVLALPVFPYHLAYETAILAGFTALALITGLRQQEERVASQIAVGVFGFLTLLPTLVTTGSSESYWIWFLPPLAAALAALGVRTVLGRDFALPLYAVAVAGLILGQLRLLGDTTATGAWVLGITPAAWFTLIFGVLVIIAAAVEDQWWITILTAYCALVAVSVTSGQVPGYVLTLVVIGISIALRAWRGRWWNIPLLSAGVLMAMIEVSRFGDSDPRVYALKLGFLAVTAVAGYASVLLDRGYPETVIAASLLIFLPMFTQSLTSTSPVLFTTVLALEAVVMTLLGVGMNARGQLFIGSGMVAVAAVRGAVLAYTSGVPVALIIAGLALFLLAVATWLSLQSRVLSAHAGGESHPSHPSTSGV